MKKWICLLLALAMVLAFAGCGKEAEIPEETAPPTEPPLEITWMTLEEDRAITAQQYFVYDCESGEFVTISGTETDRIYPASVTKLFTAYLALTYLPATQRVTAGDVLNKVAYGSSVAELQEGDALTVAELVEGMLLPSGNDAAYVLAEAAGKVLDKEAESTTAAVDAFVAEMNRQAAVLGMTGTHFANPDGIHADDHYTTFQDVVTMGLLALEDPTILSFTALSQDSKTLGSGVKTWKNTNALVDANSEYYCPYAIGLKTGQTPMAGSCLLSAFEIRGTTLLIGVFGCPEEDGRFADTLQLLNEWIEKEGV